MPITDPVSRTVTPNDLAGALKSAGFTDAQIPTLVAIGLAESSGDPAASHLNSNGTVDSGIWQINTVNKQALALGNPFDITVNARMAKQVFDGQGFGAWSTYNSGRFRQFLGQATMGAAAPSDFGPAGAGPAVAAPPSPTSSLLGKLNDGTFWQRIGKGALGLLIAGIAVWFVLPKTSTASGGRAVRRVITGNVT